LSFKTKALSRYVIAKLKSSFSCAILARQKYASH
jgi:hypothetical protein